MIEPTFSLDDVPSSSPRERYLPIALKAEGDKLLLVLPTQAEVERQLEASEAQPSESSSSIDDGRDGAISNSELLWLEIWQELKHLLQVKEKTWSAGTPVTLRSGDRLLDARQLQTIAETLSDVELRLTAVSTSRRQTAVAAATGGYSVEQQDLTTATQASTPLLAEPLYVSHTVRSGVEIRHQGTIIIFGDLNPGGKAIAAGDIFVWGRLRGIAHAGSRGDRQCRIAALQMEFTQLRIADAVVRSPKTRPKRFVPESAFMTKDGIVLANSLDFNKTYTFSPSGGGWVEKNQIN